MAEAEEETWLADQLVSAGKLTRGQLAAALETQRQRGGPGRVRLAEILVEQGLVSAAEFEETQLDSAPAGALFAAGTLVGRFEVRAELGRGGMGAVYRAYDPQLDREVAIKVILVGDSHDAVESLARFQREAQVIARLRHRGIVSIHEVGTHEGQSFIAMELVDGASLQDLLGRDPPPSTRELVEIISQVADALHHAHGRGVVHRDVKPANVMVDQAGCPQLMDFGIARDLATSEDLTATGEVIGTLTYLAPEQAGASGLKAGPYTDVYALGATLYRAVTGRPPFVADSAVAIIKQILMDDPVPLRRLVATVPADLETITLKCLEKDPRCRYASAASLADDLRRFLAGEPILARPRGPRERAVRWLRRNPGVVAAGALGVVAFVAAGMALREPDPGAADRRARIEPRGVREAPRRRDVSPAVEPGQAPAAAAPAEAALKNEVLERERFFARLREQGDMLSVFQSPDASNDVVFEVRVPAEMVGEDLSHLTALPELTKLKIGNTPFLDAGMAFLRPLTQLLQLDLSNTRITDAGLEHLEGMVRLSRLDLRDTQVTSAGLQHLQGLWSINELHLGGTKVGDAGLENLAGLEFLKKLWLGGTRVSDTGLEHLQKMKRLEDLHLDGTRVSDAGLVYLQALKMLEELNLGRTQVTDAGLEHFQWMKQLRGLSLGGTRVTDSGLVHLQALKRLEELFLSGTRVTDAGLEHLKGLTKLRWLSLTRTKVTDAGLVHLKGLTRLERLSLGGTQVTDAGLVHLQRMKQLSVLTLTDCPVTDAGVAALQAALPSCEIHR